MEMLKCGHLISGLAVFRKGRLSNNSAE